MSKKRTLAAKNSTVQRRSAPKARQPEADSRLLLEPSDNIFDDDLEFRYFSIWFSDRSRIGGGFFEEELWEKTIPQLSQQHASIRYAAMAVGAMNQSVRKGFMAQTPAELAANGPDYGPALSYYGKALGALRGAGVDSDGLRAAVICCLLFLCFESLHGDSRAAFSHSNNGQIMLDEMMKRRCWPDGDANPLGSETLERDVIHTFQRFMYQSWSCGVLRPRLQDRSQPPSPGHAMSSLPWCCRGGLGQERLVDEMPDSFDDLVTARRWWEITQHYIIHSSDMVFRITHHDLANEFVTECNNRIASHLHRTGMIRAGEILTPLPENQHFQQILSRWLSAFQPVWDASVSCTANNYDTFIKAAHLRIQYLNLFTCAVAPLSCDYATIARLTPIFREIVSLSEIVLHHQRDATSPAGGEVFTMDTSPTYPLFIASMRCRDFEVREQAVRILGRHPRRDGLWDSRMFHALASRNRAVEIWNARQGSREEQWWRLQSRMAYFDEEGILMATALTQNPISGVWEDGEGEIGCFMHMN